MDGSHRVKRSGFQLQAYPLESISLISDVVFSGIQYRWQIPPVQVLMPPAR